MSAEQALDELIDTSKAGPEAQAALYEAGYVEPNPFSRTGAFTPTLAGQKALKKRRIERAK